MDNNEQLINDEVYPPGVLQLWLENTSAAIFYDRLKSMVMGQDDELKKAAILIYGFLIAMANNRLEKKFHFMIEGSRHLGHPLLEHVRLRCRRPCRGRRERPEPQGPGHHRPQIQEGCLLRL